MKKIYLNKNGERLTSIIFLIALFFGAVDSENMNAFLISKIVSFLLLAIVFVLLHYRKED